MTLAPSTIDKDSLAYSGEHASCPESRVTTDADGIAAFDYIPRNAVRRIGVYVFSEEYKTVMESPSCDLRSPDQVVDLYLVRAVPASGRVLDADGAPAPGVRVRALGTNTDSERGHNATTLTAADGTYRLSLFPERTYSIGVEDRRFTARTRHQVVPPEGAALSGLDFRLIPGVVLKGQVTDGDGSPLVRRLVRTFEEGGPAHAPSVGDRPGRSPHWGQQRAGFRREAFTDEDGRYSFRVPPGRYRLPEKDLFWEEPTSLGDHPEFLYDYQAPSQPQRTLAVTVRRDGPNGPVVPSARVEAGGGLNGSWFYYRGGDADSQGKLEARLTPFPQFMPGPIRLYARSPDGSFAGLATAGPDDEQATIILKPATSIRGRVVLGGRSPVPAARVSIRLAQPDAPDSGVHLDAYCDAEGRFAVAGIPLGALVKADAAPGNGSEGKAEVAAEGPGPITLPDASISRLDPNF